MLKKAFAILTQPINGYNSLKRVEHTAERLYAAAPYDGQHVAAVDAAHELKSVHDNSRLGYRGFAFAAAIALSGALFIPNTPAKMALSPTAALLLLLARDERRARNAAAKHISSQQYEYVLRPSPLLRRKGWTPPGPLGLPGGSR